MEVAVLSDAGSLARLNDDGWFAEQLHRNVTLLGVADGFGRPDGCSAAEIVLDSIREYIRQELRRATFPPRSLTVDDVRAVLAAAYANANVRLFHAAGGDDDNVAAGSGCSVALVVGRQAFVAHMGNARVYLLRRGELVQLTTDESMMLETVRAGGWRRAATAGATHRPLLVRALGLEPDMSAPAKVAHYALQHNDALLLCTDGVYANLSVSDIASIASARERPGLSLSRLINAARSAGSTDDATALLARGVTAHGAPVERQAPGWGLHAPFAALLAAAALSWFGALGMLWLENDHHLYVSADPTGMVTLYAGVPSLGGLPLHRVVRHYGIAASSLSAPGREALEAARPVASADAADALVRAWQASADR